MQPKLVTTSIVTLAIALGACGYGSDSSDDAATAPAGDASGEAAAPESGETAPEPGEAADSAVVVQVGQTDLGEVLTDAEGLTLYGLTDDVDRVPTCYGDCANTWPPLLVESGELPAGLDPELFSVVEREDGTWQLVAGNWPLYTFSGDSAPGDTNGQGSGGVWFAVAPDGQLIQDSEDDGEADEGSTETPEETPETTEPGSGGYDDGYESSEPTETTEAPSDEGYDSGTDDGYGSSGNDDTGDGYDGGGY